MSLGRILNAHAKFVLVFDGIDRQREAPPGLMAALARLNDYIPNLSVIFLTRDPFSIELHQVGMAHVSFPAYTREQALEIVANCPLRIDQGQIEALSASQNTAPGEDDIWLWTRFCEAVWDSQAKFIGGDIVSFQAITRKLWRPFVVPILDGTYGPRDFSRLVVAQRALFQSEDLLDDKVRFAKSSVIGVVGSSADEPRKLDLSKTTKCAATYEMPYYSKYLLCAAYLASYNPSRTDSIYFMKAAERRRRRRGGGAKVGRKPMHRKVRTMPFPYRYHFLR